MIFKRKHYHSVHALSTAIEKDIAKGAWDTALKSIHDFVTRIISEPLCTSQIFGSAILDTFCQKIGRHNFSRLNLPTASQKEALLTQRSPTFVYLVTKLQKSGGHTRVLVDFIRSRGNSHHVILSTELEGQSDFSFVLDMLGDIPSIVVETAPSGNFLLRLTWLQRYLSSLPFDHVYLFNHHQDSVIAAAVVPEMGLQGSFYHHGDHHLCLGVYLSHLAHIDPHPMGYNNCRDVLGIDNIYVPLTLDDKGDHPSYQFLHSGVLTTCTAARSNKIEIPYVFSYFDVIPQLLKATKGRHIHIGFLNPWYLFRIRRSLTKLGISSDRFIYIPWVVSVWETLQKNKVDVYIASFPYGGGLTLIEAMGAGVPVVLHRHIFSRILSGLDIAHPDAFSWRWPEDLITYCLHLTPDALAKAGKSGREQYEKFHTKQTLSRILNAQDNYKCSPNMVNQDFTVAVDEWALWMEQQLNMPRLLYRMIYRFLKFSRIRY